MHYNFVVEGLQSWALFVFPPTGLFPETHHPRLLQTVSFPPLCFVFLPWRNVSQKIFGFFCFSKLLKDSSFLAPILTRLTNFVIFQKGWENCSFWKSHPEYRCFTVLMLLSSDVQDRRSVWTIYAAYKCWLLGHVVRHTLQWWKPSYGQVCVCVNSCFSSTSSSDAFFLSQYSAVHQSEAKTQRALGGCAHIYVCAMWVHSCIIISSIVLAKCSTSLGLKWVSLSC